MKIDICSPLNVLLCCFLRVAAVACLPLSVALCAETGKQSIAECVGSASADYEDGRLSSKQNGAGLATQAERKFKRENR